MKKIILGLSLLIWSQINYALTTVEDLKFDCYGKAKIVKASQVKYSPGLPERGRFPGAPPYASVLLELEVLSKSDECSVLKDKYQYELNHLEIATEVSPAKKASEISYLPVVGKIVDYYFSQNYKYVFNKKWLSFYPDLVQEKITAHMGPIKVKEFQLEGSDNIEEIDTHKAHGSTPIAQKTDFEKMALAKKVLNQSQYGDYSKLYGQTLLELEPETKELKAPYAKTLWAYLHMLKGTQKAPYGFFHFNVGGIGLFDGAPISNKVLKLQKEHQALNEADTIHYVVEFPTALLSWGQGACAVITDQMMEEIIGQIYVQLPIMTPFEKSLVKRLLTEHHSFGFSQCGYKLEVSEQAVKWIQEILESLESK